MSSISHDFCACDASLDVLLSITLITVLSTDFASDEDDVLTAVCDSKISSSKQIAELDGETRFVCFSGWGPCGICGGCVSGSA